MYDFLLLVAIAAVFHWAYVATIGRSPLERLWDYYKQRGEVTVVDEAEDKKDETQ